ncbi:MAG TPA: ion transporter [Bacteroidales bacterium]|nr:ion transporter [Bacteroidales bacterium]
MKKLLLNNKFILWLIILNALVIFVMSFEGISKPFEIALSIADVLLTLVFVAELYLKTKTRGVRKYLSTAWNRFDFVVISVSFFSIFLYCIDTTTVNLSFVIVLRVARVFKTFRFIEFIPDIGSLLKGIQRAFKSSVLVLISLFVYNFILGVFSCHLFKSVAPEYFGNPMISLYSIFQIFTVEGWYEIPNTIASNSTPALGALATVYFILILVSGGILGLSLVNSIFVDAMIADNNDELEKKVDSLNEKITRLSEQIENLSKQDK